MSSGSSSAVVVSGHLPIPRLITIAVLAMGGEGGGVLSDWIVDLAEDAGYYAQSTSVPGVAQRTGATIYYIEIFPKLLGSCDGKTPILALMPVPGQVDVVVASELMEAGRAIQRGLVTADRTTLIASTHRVYSMTERVAMADGRADTGVFLDAARASAKTLVIEDFAKIADRAGAVISAALFGGLAGTGVLPFSRTRFEDAIRRGGIGVDASLRAFDAGYEAAVGAPAVIPVARLPVVDSHVGPRLTQVAKRVQEEFPELSHEILYPAIRRLAEYQDVRYANEYLDKLLPVRNLDTKAQEYTLLRETARYLALWLSYEDAIRVADLKTRSSRFERVQRDSRANGSQVIEINEFLSPQPQEVADLLPIAIGNWLLRSKGAKGLIERVAGEGKVVQTTSLHGFLTLFLLSQMRFIRRKSLRFRVEQDETTKWLAAICQSSPEKYKLAVEIAECGQLIKGYGDTHANGVRNFDKIMDRLPTIRSRADGAAVLLLLRKAALADDTGTALEAALTGLSANTLVPLSG